MTKTVAIKGTMDLNGQSVPVGANYNINVESGGALTNNSSTGATLALTGNNTKLTVSGSLTNNSTNKMIINCNGSGSNDGDAGIVLNSNASLENGESAGGFEFNINGSNTCIKVANSMDMTSASATINVGENASGTVLSIETGGTFSIGALTLN